jgi:hypothetical protein
MEKKKSPKANETSSTRRASNQARHSGFFSSSIQQLLSHYLEYELGPVEWSARTEMLDMGNTENVRKKKR